MMVAIPELDGATGPMVFGGRSAPTAARLRARCPARDSRAMHPASSAPRCSPRGSRGWSRCAAAPRAERKVAHRALQLPAECRRAGTAAYLGVFESLHNTLRALKADGYGVEVPGQRRRAARRGASAATPAASAPAPTCTPASPPTTIVRARALAARDRGAVGSGARASTRPTARSIFVLGAAVRQRLRRRAARLRLRRRPDAAAVREAASRRRTPSPPSTAGSARTSAPTCVLHFGTHGALEFMPGKQAGLSRRLLARPADRRPAERLSLRRQQSVRGHDRQAPRRRDADQLPDAAGGAGRALPRPRST